MTLQEFAELRRKGLPEFHALALTLTRDEDRAQDLLQEVFYLVLKNRQAYRLGTNFTAWVKAIIRNTFISGYRRDKRRRELLARDRPAASYLANRAVINAAEPGLEAEAIMAYVEALPAAYRRAFLLHYRGLKYREIAALTAVPVGTAKSRVHMARRLLRDRLGRVGIRGN